MEIRKKQLYLEGLYPDLLFTNAQNEYLIVEVQIGKLDRYHLYKNLEYRDLFFINYKVKPKVIVACEFIPEHYKQIAKIHNIKLITQKFKSCYEISTRDLDTDMICKKITNLFDK